MAAVALAKLGDSVQLKAGVWSAFAKGGTWGFSESGSILLVGELEHTYSLAGGELPGIVAIGAIPRLHSHLDFANVGVTISVSESNQVVVHWHLECWPLLDSAGRSIASSTRGGNQAESIVRTLAPGTYVVRVYRYSGDTNYRLTMTATPVQNAVPDYAGNSLNAARNLGVLGGLRSFSDFVGSSDRDDYYRFQLLGRTAFNLSLTGVSADADVQLLDSDGRTIAG